ncbi:Rieske 2Fe-2S domain-containing protein [Streptomyces sp. NPDC048680]|uniref:Rieske 2Fe-2S domain-containing protein n=1 Tax=Streptomyces sp. NPDC048680 TaxID=3155492 RepID=UPI003427E79E
MGACCSLLRAGLKRPAEMSRPIGLSGFVDAEDGPVDRAVFTDAELYRLEWARVFARIRACLDSCPHCGTQVCRTGSGSIRNCTCTHHGWSLDLADALVSVAERSDHPESFDTTAWDLVEVLYIESPHQLNSGSRNPEPVPPREPLGDMAWCRGAMSDHDDQGPVVADEVHGWESEYNWKPAPCGLGQSPRVRPRASAAASCPGGMEGRGPA